MNEQALEVKDLLITYNQFRLAIDHLSLESGYIYGLVGQNGAGKTTFLKAILNLVRHINDEILIYGKRLDEHEMELKNRIGYVNDEFLYPLNMNANQLAKNVGVFYKNFDINLYEQLLARFQISKHTKFKELSKGNKHKMMIIFALSYHPDLLILDEPTANIDPVVRREVLDLLQESMDDSKTILFSTHITSDLDRICDYVILLEHGHIVFQLAKNQMEEDYQIVTMQEVDDQIKPYLKGISKNELGYKALCTNTQQFMNDPRYTFKRANIEEIMYYWELYRE